MKQVLDARPDPIALVEHRFKDDTAKRLRNTALIRRMVPCTYASMLLIQSIERNPYDDHHINMAAAVAVVVVCSLWFRANNLNGNYN
jgi:hypothetical protein